MPQRQIEVVDTVYGIYHAFKDDLITDQLRTYSAHTRNELAMVLDHVEPKDCVLDIGAHIGTYGIPIAKKAIHGQVYCIEAEEEVFKLLCKNVSINDMEDRITCHNFVAAGTSWRYRKGNGVDHSNSGANYYIRSEVKQDTIGLNLATWIADLDLDHIDFIKMDIEGMEYQVLSSVLHILERDRPKLYLEIVEDQLKRQGDSPQDIQDLLDSIGYRYYVNTYKRNSAEDKYVKMEIESFTYSGFFDVLALPSL